MTIHQAACLIGFLPFIHPSLFSLFSLSLAITLNLSPRPLLSEPPFQNLSLAQDGKVYMVARPMSYAIWLRSALMIVREGGRSADDRVTEWKGEGREEGRREEMGSCACGSVE